MDPITQLRRLAAEVRHYQLERGWSDARLCREIASVGSSKTYKRILDDTDALAELNVANQLRNFASAAEVVAGLRQRDLPPEPEYEDFDNLVNAEAAVRRAAREDEDCVARLVIIEGNTATGKDAVRRHLLRKFPNAAVSVEAAELVAELIAALRQRKLILIINEAHHLGPRGLNLVKTLLNQTPGVIVLECIPVLLTRLLGSSYEEAVQLTGNRLAERVLLAPPSAEEILLLLDRRGVKFETAAARDLAGRELAAAAPQYGNWRFVTQVTRKLYDAARRAPVGAGGVTQAVAAVKGMRTRILAK